MDLGLKGALALVVGGSRGIGLATARALTQEGARVVLMARDGAALRDAAAGLGADMLPCDLTDDASVATAFATLLAGHGCPDACVISAGAAQGGLMWDLPDAVWQQAMDLKFMGLVRVLRHIAPAMQARGQGRIVAVVGNNGRQPGARMLPGSAANAACLALVRGLAEELAPSGVSLNALNPGPTRTDRWDRLVAGLAAQTGTDPAAQEATMLAGMPRGRIATAEEMGKLAVLLCSDLAEMVTGTALTADGGATKGLP